MNHTMRRKVFSARNSICVVPMDWLDQANWFTEDFDKLYLHVQGDAKADPTGEYGLASCVYRVYCRATDKPRLRMINGVLYWLIDKP